MAGGPFAIGCIRMRNGEADLLGCQAIGATTFITEFVVAQKSPGTAGAFLNFFLMYVRA